MVNRQRRRLGLAGIGILALADLVARSARPDRGDPSGRPRDFLSVTPQELLDRGLAVEVGEARTRHQAVFTEAVRVGLVARQGGHALEQAP